MKSRVCVQNSTPASSPLKNQATKHAKAVRFWPAGPKHISLPQSRTQNPRAKEPEDSGYETEGAWESDVVSMASCLTNYVT